jgi:hypothetical protein
MPDLNQIKQGEQERATGAGGRQGSVRQSCRAAPRAHQPSHSGSRTVARGQDQRLLPATAACRDQPRGYRSRHVRPSRAALPTNRRDFAADSLQMLRGAITDAIRDCSTGQLRVKPHGCPVHRLRWTAERSGWARIPNRLDRRSASFETAAEPVLGPAKGRTRGRPPQSL